MSALSHICMDSTKSFTKNALAWIKIIFREAILEDCTDQRVTLKLNIHVANISLQDQVSRPPSAVARNLGRSIAVYDGPWCPDNADKFLLD